MWVVGHAQVGWFLARGVRLGQRDRRLVTWCALFPDLDAVTLLAGHDAYLRGHHVYLHNLPTIVGLALAAGVLARRRLTTAALGLAAGLLHIVSDGFGYLELRPLWPFSRRLFWPNDGRHWVAALGEVGVPVVLLAAGLWLFARERITVLEALSTRIDPWLVGRLQERARGLSRPSPSEVAAAGGIARWLALELVAAVTLIGVLALVAQAVLEIVARRDWGHALVAAVPAYVGVRWVLPAILVRVLDGLAVRMAADAAPECGTADPEA